MATLLEKIDTHDFFTTVIRSWTTHRRHWLSAVVITIALISLCIFTPLNTWPGFTHHMYTLVVNDTDRRDTAHDIMAGERWRLMELERIYGQNECKRKGRVSNPKWGWITAIANNKFVLPSVVLGHTLNVFSCQRKMIALVSRDVSAVNRGALERVGWDVVEVEALDCNWLDKQQGREPRNIGILGTHMRFHVWTFSSYEKLIYIDGDFLVLSNIDELFEINGEFAACHCARPGMIDLCFNAGLAVIQPSKQTYSDIMKYWKERGSNGRCISDQLLFWYFFGGSNRWTPISYAYNVRRMIYWPMKAYHFAGTIFYKKPWEYCPLPTKDEALKFDGPIRVVEDLFVLWWKFFYEMQEKYRLTEWWDQFQKNVLKLRQNGDCG